jgi:hypothetical protein
MTTCICIPIPESPGSEKPGWFVRLLQRVIPAINPDFEHLYDQVVMWHVEIDSATGEPLREVGLDARQRVIAIGPWRDNYGYMVDCGGTFVPAEHAQISAGQFEQEWQSFDSGPPTS